MFSCVRIVFSQISVFIPILKLLLVVYGCTTVENYDKIYMKIEGESIGVKNVITTAPLAVKTAKRELHKRKNPTSFPILKK